MGASVSVLAVVHSVTFAIGRRIGRYNVVDVAWGVGLWPSPSSGWARPRRPHPAVAAAGTRGDLGLRLSWHIQREPMGKGEDRRYAAYCGGHDRPGGARGLVLQGFIPWFVRPLQLSAYLTGRPGAADPVGCSGMAVWWWA